MKFNKGFWSIRDFISGVPNFNGDIRYNPTHQSQLLGGLQPLGDLIKDLSNIFKPYKTFDSFWNDLLQPLVGISLIIGGFIWTIAPPIIHVGLVISNALGKNNQVPTTSQTLSWMLKGISSMLSGAIKIVTAPLNYFIRMPVRLVTTAFKKPNNESFEQKQSVQALVKTARHNTLENTADICLELNRKYKKAVEKKIPTAIDRTNENELFKPINICQNGVRQLPTAENCMRYLSLFKIKKSFSYQDEGLPLLTIRDFSNRHCN